MSRDNIEKAREELNELIEKDSDFKSIQKASQKVDEFIVKFYKEKLNKENVESENNEEEPEENTKSDT